MLYHAKTSFRKAAPPVIWREIRRKPWSGLASDAAEIFVKTNTGDVTGTLLSEKVFIVGSDTGNVDVPKTATGGRCEITTDTGDIRIKLQK